MSVTLQFECPTYNETARKAMESYIGILQKAFEHYQNLWEDYIKLQEKCQEYNVYSSSQATVTTSMKTNDEATSLRSQHSSNANVEESNIPLLELDTMNTSLINLDYDMTTSSTDASESLRKSADQNSPPRSPVFSRTVSRTRSNSAKNFVRSPKAVCDNSQPASNINTRDNMKKVSSKCNHKLELSTTHHVETTFLPNGKRLKQSRLAFCPVKSGEKLKQSSNVNRHKANILQNTEITERNFVDVSVANTAADATVTGNNATNNTSEIFEDVIEISPTQRNVISKVKRCLRLKRKVPVKHVNKFSPTKDKYSGPSAALKTVDVDFGFCPSPKHTQMEGAKSLMNTAVDTLKYNRNYLSPIKMHKKTDVQVEKFIEARKKDQLLTNNVPIQNINDSTSEDETFYLPAEEAANKIDMDNFSLNDTENKPPKKRLLFDRLNVLPKRKTDFTEQLNMRCKADRAKLNGWDCWECKEYYENLSLSKEELQKRKNQCSRHRHKYERPNTPEGFWNPEFPETLSCTYRQN
ncbi:PREDICTED: DNA endonuclease RBBP8-like [Vollenhovia emeryi]|uniref:DNA endonuclease RBBP8-like n=1 Tax=Vollenhovia emeryi TaxID=411798 RepID=UPI0005F44222|nr:PREDICTED: DNA endonuclease RBBP8-like [Vollenhovia emeryi]